MDTESEKQIREILADDAKLKEKTEEAFKEVDTDGSGFLSIEELKGALKNIAASFDVSQPTDAAIRKAMGNLDKNSDGKLDPNEFSTLVKQLFQLKLKQIEKEKKDTNSTTKTEESKSSPSTKTATRNQEPHRVSESDGSSSEVFQKLQQQNERLRSELQSLKELAKERLDKAKQQKQAANATTRDYDDVELKKLQGQIKTLKKEVEKVRVLADADMYDKVVVMENTLKEKNLVLRNLKAEVKSLKAVKQSQEVALQYSGVSAERVKELQEQLTQQREKLKKATAKRQTDEKELNQHHEKFVKLEEICRKMNDRLKLARKSKTDTSELRDAGEEDVNEKEIGDLEEQKKQATKDFKKSLHEKDAKIQELQATLNEVSQQFREKDQESKMINLKKREYMRKIPHNILMPLGREKKRVTSSSSRTELESSSSKSSKTRRQKSVDKTSSRR